MRDRAGRTIRLAQRRIVSMDDPHLAALVSTIVAEDWSGTLQIRSALDGRVSNTGEPRLPSAIGELRPGLRYRGHWGIDLTCRQDLIRVALRPGAACPIRVSYRAEDIEIQPGASWETRLDSGRPLEPSAGTSDRPYGAGTDGDRPGDQGPLPLRPAARTMES